MKERFKRKLVTNSTGIDFAMVSKSKINTPTAKVLTAATIWFSVVEDKNSPIDKSAPAIRSIPKKFPNKIPKLGNVKNEIIKV